VVISLGVAAAIVLADGDDEASDGATSAASTVATIPDTSTVPTLPGTPTVPESTPSETTSAPEPTQAPATTTAPAETSAPTTASPVPGESTCRYVGTDFADDMQVELSFTNPLGEQPSLEVSYTLLDGEGVRFLTDSALVELVSADEEFRIEDDTLTPVPSGVDESAIGCTVLEVAEGFGRDDVTAPSDGDACEFVEVDSFDDIQVELTITSAFSETTNVQIYYALRGPDGVRFATDSGFVDLVAPGETVRSNEDSVTEVPSWMTADDVNCDIIGVVATDF
jgi:hypothetical protein